MKGAIFVITIGLLTFSSALLRPRKSECETSSDCQAGQCCVPNSQFMIASKRAVDLLSPDLISFDMMKGGTCVNYVQEGQSCHYLGFASCGCEPGTTCNYYPAKPEKLEEPIELSKRIIALRPGDSFCEAV